MMHPFLGNSVLILQYGLLWVVYALLQALALNWLLSLPFWILLTDGVFRAVLFAGIGLLLWSVVKYGNYSGLPGYLRLVNYTALGLITISVWLSVSYGFFYLMFGSNLIAPLITVLPMYGLIGLLLYILIIHYCRFSYHTSKLLAITEAQREKVVIPDGPNLPAEIDVEILERIAVRSGQKIHVVLVPDIQYLQADGDYVQIFSAQGKFLKEQTMKYFEEHLPRNQFVRIHRSCIVNVEMISRIELYEKQNQLLTLKNGDRLKTSPSGYKALRLALNL